jgi:hypothetical protein
VARSARSACRRSPPTPAGRRKLFWGTVRYAHDDEAGGARLNLGRRGSASLRLAPDTLTSLLECHDTHDLEELQGASFVGYLPLRKCTTSDRLFS